jgi:hypothetical protein
VNQLADYDYRKNPNWLSDHAGAVTTRYNEVGHKCELCGKPGGNPFCWTYCTEDKYLFGFCASRIKFSINPNDYIIVCTACRKKLFDQHGEDMWKAKELQYDIFDLL